MENVDGRLIKLAEGDDVRLTELKVATRERKFGVTNGSREAAPQQHRFPP